MTRRWLLIVGVVVGLGAPFAAAAPPQGDHDHDGDERNAHPHDPVLQAEHTDMLRLVPRAAVTHSAVRDGRWSDGATWQDGKRPVADANVLIPRGKTVIVDGIMDVPLRTVRIDGKLTFDPNRDTCFTY